MKTEKRMNELKADAWDAHSVEVKADAAWDAALAIYKNAATSRDAAYAIFTDAEDSREAALDIYMKAGAALTNSHHAAQRAANAANAYEAGEYETNPYFEGIDSTDNTEEII